MGASVVIVIKSNRMDFVEGCLEIKSMVLIRMMQSVLGIGNWVKRRPSMAPSNRMGVM